MNIMLPISTAVKTIENILAVTTMAGKPMENMEIYKNLSSDMKRNVVLSGGSIFKLIGDYIITPQFYVSESLRNNDAITDALLHNMDYFSAGYTIAFKALTTVYNVDINTTMQLLSSRGNKNLYLEHQSRDFENKFLCLDEQKDKNGVKFEVKDESRLDTKANKLIDRMINISIKTKINDIDINFEMNMMVRATVNYVPFNEIYSASLAKSDRTSFIERWHAWRGGEISFFKGMIWADDLVKEYKKSKLSGKTDILGKMNRRDDVAYSKVVTDGAIGFGKYYAFMLINAEEAKRLEIGLGGKFNNNNVKDKYLDSMSSMGLTVIDDSFDTVTFMLLDLVGSSTIRKKDLKKDGKNDDMMKILEALVAGRTY